ncbi:4-hydroxy-tetrahydrodipicolinate reductase [Ponticaulis sp.]|uniref:4-hydroxy-tetrahydrodipicolinate reductase n=1 Tax=Ponticaulis sp. TaxID=2020902 RepID=UPI000B684172|nr:4-hydroxy-tetrahydrodipicolinate reductase [Ponticaulis sp.]MAI91107.1 4-hydroxy-tetrahydrodipicolinate reductase [Ponticaulis sp.]OUX98605.1 MAG: 4-hydroxy-tetrahydrodipicolinate reductase [Hyphomonadaceae bacterium TMED5]|tara:strand:- start:30358 stop:31176 length:819 start_codon:yes stop_codon:yes gene_type:complete
MNTHSPIHIAISGAAGRMGQTLTGLAYDDAGLKLVGATEAPAFDGLGKDVGLLSGLGNTGITLSSDIEAAASDASCFVDFTRPKATLAALKALQSTRVRCVVIGTTGFSSDEMFALQEWSSRYAIVFSGNYSLGVNMLAALVTRAAKSLGEDWDIEILETHHRHKVDAPSGTALLLGDAAAEGRGAPLSDLRIPPYDGVTGERPEGKIGFSVRRSGGVIGEHEVSFGSEEEILSLSHTALNRKVFARGALHAAKWGVNQPPGWYSMKDVLGL